MHYSQDIPEICIGIEKIENRHFDDAEAMIKLEPPVKISMIKIQYNKEHVTGVKLRYKSIDGRTVKGTCSLKFKLLWGLFSGTKEEKYHIGNGDFIKEIHGYVGKEINQLGFSTYKGVKRSCGIEKGIRFSHHFPFHTFTAARGSFDKFLEFIAFRAVPLTPQQIIKLGLNNNITIQVTQITQLQQFGKCPQNGNPQNQLQSQYFPPVQRQYIFNPESQFPSHPAQTILNPPPPPPKQYPLPGQYPTPPVQFTQPGQYPTLPNQYPLPQYSSRHGQYLPPPQGQHRIQGQYSPPQGQYFSPPSAQYQPQPCYYSPQRQKQYPQGQSPPSLGNYSTKNEAIIITNETPPLPPPPQLVSQDQQLIDSSVLKTGLANNPPHQANGDNIKLEIVENLGH